MCLYRPRKIHHLHSCRFCKSTFSSETVAASHENAVHENQHPRSCGGLKHVNSAFYVLNKDDQILHEKGDRICLLCGKLFTASQRNWEYDSHLVIFHKFGKCATSKTLYIPSHFRQHLINCHATVIGWWTDRLENLYAQQMVATNDNERPIGPLVSHEMLQGAAERSRKGKHDLLNRSGAPDHEASKMPASKSGQSTSTDPQLCLSRKTDEIISERAKPSPTQAWCEQESINVVGEAPESQCYICGESVTLTGQRAWQ